MIQKIFPDIAIAAVISALAFFIAASPRPTIPVPSNYSDKHVSQPAGEPQKKWAPPVPLDSVLKNRNLFAESGSYAVNEKSPLTLPENYYSLVAVLMGKEKKAVLKDLNGVIQTFPAGKTLLDGSVITEITSVSITLNKKNKAKKLKLFDVQLGAVLTGKETGKTGQIKR